MTNVCVWAAGTQEANGTYEESLKNGQSLLIGGRRSFKKEELSIVWDEEICCWKLGNDEQDFYINEEDTDIPPPEKWQMHDGAYPAPSLSSDEHASKGAAPVCKAAEFLNMYGLNIKGHGINLEGVTPELKKYKGFYNRMSMYPRCLVSNISMSPQLWAERTKGFYWVQRTRMVSGGDHYVIYAKCANQLRLGTRHRKNWRRSASNKYTPAEFDNITWAHDTQFTLQLPECGREWTQEQMEHFMLNPASENEFRPKGDIKRPMEEIKFMDNIAGVSALEREDIRKEYLMKCDKKWQETFGLGEKHLKSMIEIHQTTPVFKRNSVEASLKPKLIF